MSLDVHRASSRIPVIFCIDVEPDPRLVNRYSPEPWVGYESTHRYLSEMRPRLEEQTGTAVRYSWFFRMDPQVAESYGSAAYPMERYASFIEEIQSHRDELGIHVHAYRWSEKEENWIHDFSREWTEHCIRTSLEAFVKAQGRDCISYRSGDYWHSTQSVNFLEQMGVRFDLTVAPGLRPGQVPQAGQPDWSLIPRYYRVPRTPYVPSESDFRRPGRPGSRNIIMIPMTSTYLLGRPFYSRLGRILFNGIRNRHQDTPLHIWLCRKAPNTFGSLMDRAIAAQEKPYLAFELRSDVCINHKLFEGFKACVQTILSHPARNRFVFCTPAEALSMLGYGLPLQSTKPHFSQEQPPK